ncbi:MAG: response regulator [Nitriliruptoraceae bacterium]|nr:response regulator [Nitriliruptoraceae bacterium]
MSGRLSVLVLEDEAEVRDAIVRDLGPFDGLVRVEPADDVPDARAVLQELAADGDHLALILADHRLPGTTGVELLVELAEDPATRAVRRVLLTGQADHADTIRAINEGGLHHYLAKPWDPAQLDEVVRRELTTFVLEQGLDPLPHLRALDAVRVMPTLRGRGDR